MKTAYLDCNAGISGNMFLGALIHLGMPGHYLLTELKKLAVNLPDLAINSVTRKGIAATFVAVPETHEHHHRHLPAIFNIIETAALDIKVKQNAKKSFLLLAEAEAKVHGIPVEEVHFHEVGAIDAIIDIVGAAIGIEYFQIEKIVASPVRMGFGTIDCAHGIIPLPAPATVELLKGVAVFGGDLEGEWTTPTGAALFKTYVSVEGSLPKMRIIGTGYGAGSKDRAIPNVLRLILGEEEYSNFGTEEQLILETNLDDMNPEILGYLGDLLLEAGAKDFYYTPVQMKKGRPGILITVLVSLDKASLVEQVLLNETTTLGVRRYNVSRRCLERSFITVKIGDEAVKVKTAWKDGTLINYAPEYEDCRNLAKKLGIPLKEIYEEAKSKARNILKIGGAS